MAQSEKTLAQAFARRRTGRRFTGAAVSLPALGRLLWAAQGITGPDGRRTAPSAHALHPLRLIVLAQRIDGLGAGSYQVNPHDLSLARCVGRNLLPALRQTAIGDQSWISEAACVVAVCANMNAASEAFAEQKPIRQRGARYVYLEAGAAAQNLQLQAVAEELSIVWVGGFDDEAAAEVLGLQNGLSPILLLCVGHPAGEA